MMRVADCDACADLILEHSHPVSILTRQADDVQKAFQDCHRQLAGLVRYGAGTTEADTLLESLALPKVRALELTVKTMREQMEKALRSSSRVATDFPTQKALDKYLKEHPDADRTNHRVVDTTESEMGQGLRQWVKDYKDSPDRGIRRQIKQDIDRVVREKGLDRKRVMKGALISVARELAGSDQYQNLNEAAFNTGDPGFDVGNTAIWYMNGDFFRDGIMGYDWLADHGMLPDPTSVKTLSKTHIFLGRISETNLGKVYRMMQGEIWSPMGEARNLIRNKGLHHTSMSIGDIIVVNREVFMVDRMGFKTLGRL
jgi:hypothetical protein